jgi:glycine cleavage system H lipoate-binding protein
MIPHDLLTMFSIKAVEYFIGVAFLLLFIPFWRFVNAERVAERVAVVEFPKRLGPVADWFLVPELVYLHPGHAWARVDDGELVTVGMDDFAQKLVGRMPKIRLPEVGSRVGQGEQAWSIVSDSRLIDMLSPVDGTVVAVNNHAVATPEKLNLDPYGDGWLLKVRAPRLKANVKQLLLGTMAQRWMEEVCENLRARISPDLGRVYQDGGLPIYGIARGLDRERWDEVCRDFFLT